VAVWTPYCGAGPTPAELWTRWNADPPLLAGLAVAAAVVWLSGRRRTGFRPRLAAAAFVVLLVSFVSPLCALSSALFSARVVHHVLLVAVAAPLLVWATPRGSDVKSRAAGWTALHAAVLWAWHAPDLYAAALSHEGVYWLMQASLLGSALGVWSAVRRASAPAGAAALLATMVSMGLLGAVLTFAPDPLYAPHLSTTAAWSLSPLEDQQLGGLIMWAPAAGLYLAAALALVWRAIGREPRTA
jgi:putative membrane protein